MKFIVTAETTDTFLPVSNITFPVIQEYCDRHGYEFRPKHITEPVRSVVWDRVITLQEALKDCDWAVHVDADCLITNHHIPLTEFIDASKAIVISTAPYQGKPMFNDGFCMINNSYEGRDILSRSWDMWSIEDGIHCAQDAMWDMFLNGDWESFWSVQPQKRFNSFLWTEYGESNLHTGHWTRGDYLLHCPGMTNERRCDLLQHYSQFILR